VTAAAAILAVDTYLIGSWWDWQFGGSFGHRGFTDGLGLAAIFTATFFSWAGRRPRLAIGVAIATSLAVLLSIAQMLQYWAGILPIANTTWDQYRALFLRFY
jgi:membrane-associated PAP2 superfamily phosphatase